jgi:hypothetical protein
MDIAVQGKVELQGVGQEGKRGLKGSGTGLYSTFGSLGKVPPLVPVGMPLVGDLHILNHPCDNDCDTLFLTSTIISTPRALFCRFYLSNSASYLDLF